MCGQYHVWAVSCSGGERLVFVGDGRGHQPSRFGSAAIELYTINLSMNIY